MRFAITREGRLLQAFTVDQKNHDWEDIAYDGKGRILIADIGNNRHDRQETFVHAVAEPDPNLPPQKRKESKIKAVATWTLKYPAKPFDAESLFVIGEKAYVISKLLTLEKAMLYSFDLDEKKPMQTLKAVFDLPIRMPATGADVSQDKKWLCVMTIAGPYLFRIDGDIAKAEKASPAHVFYTDKNMEACTFVPEGILATTEGRDVLLFKWKDFGVKPE